MTQQQNCPNCGAPLNAGNAFCTQCGAPVNVPMPPRGGRRSTKKPGRGKIIAIIAAAVAVVAMAALVFVVIKLLDPREPNVSTTSVSECSAEDYIDLGYRYLREGNYDKAIIAFEKAIAIDRKIAEAYVGLSEAYSAIEDYDKALEVLEEGFSKTGDSSIEDKIESVKAMIDTQTETSPATAATDISAQPSISPEPTPLDFEFTSHSVSYTAGDGYNLEVSLKISPWIDSSDTDLINKLWNDVGGVGDAPVQLFSYNAMKRTQTYWIIGTVEIINHTTGFDITSDYPLSIDYQIGATLAGYDSDITIVQNRNSVYGLGTFSRLSEKMTSNTLGPMPIMIGDRYEITPNSPSGSIDSKNIYLHNWGSQYYETIVVESLDHYRAVPPVASSTTPKPFDTAESATNGVDGKNIGICIYKFDDNFMTLYRTELERYLTSGGAKVQVMDGKNDQAEQTNQIQNFITQKVDVLIINLVQPSAASQIADICNDANIPVVFINREPEPAEEQRWATNNFKLTYVGADARRSGIIQGQLILYLPNMGDADGDGTVRYAMIQGDPDSIDAKYRTEFSVLALTDAGVEVEELFKQHGYWEQIKGQELTANALAANGAKLDVVFCNNDAMALGAMQAIESAGRVVGKDIYLVGIDALVEAVENVYIGKMTGTVFNDYIAQSHAAGDIAADFINGVAVATVNMVDYVMVTPDNAAEIRALLG